MALSNPRVSTTLSLDCRLSSVIKRLENRFRPVEDKAWLNCVAILPNADVLRSARPARNDSELWVVPKPGTVFSKPLISTKDPTTSSSLSLSKLQMKLEPLPTSSTAVAVVFEKDKEQVQKINIADSAWHRVGVGASQPAAPSSYLGVSKFFRI